MTRRLTTEERVYRALKPLMMPLRIWPDPKPQIIAAIRTALRPPKKTRREPINDTPRRRIK